MAEPGSATKDFGAAVLVVVLVMGGLSLYTGTWPPMVVVESGSMMHVEPGADVSYGRFGTIDPGDLVLVKEVDSADDICTRMSNRPDCVGDEHYGDAGDVIVYWRMNQRGPGNTPIIHRAIAWVDVRKDAGGTSYVVEGYGTFNEQGIYIPELGFNEARGFSRDRGYKPSWSGFLTKGDNVETNADTDQAGQISPQPVQLAWIDGVARGELSWFGLIKLAVSGQVQNAEKAGQWTKVGNVYAPADLWVMLGVAVVALIVLPFLVERGIRAARFRYEVARAARRQREAQAVAETDTNGKS